MYWRVVGSNVQLQKEYTLFVRLDQRVNTDRSRNVSGKFFEIDHYHSLRPPMSRGGSAVDRYAAARLRTSPRISITAVVSAWLKTPATPMGSKSVNGLS